MRAQGYPLAKAQAYELLRNPFMRNDLAMAPLLLERALLLAAQLEDEALEGRRVVVDEAALAVPLLARPALAAGAPRLALLDLAAAPRALGAALALAHRALWRDRATT